MYAFFPVPPSPPGLCEAAPPPEKVLVEVVDAAVASEHEEDEEALENAGKKSTISQVKCTKRQYYL